MEKSDLISTAQTKKPVTLYNFNDIQGKQKQESTCFNMVATITFKISSKRFLALESCSDCNSASPKHHKSGGTFDIG